jgi:hypothetical protein
VPLLERTVAGSVSREVRMKDRGGVAGTRSAGLAVLQT